MGISSAMSPKDRKLIHAGLLDQGAEVDREGKRGTLYKLPGNKRWMLPYGTGDHKARLAMRAEVRRLGLRWPLDPPEQHKKEKPVAATAAAPTRTLEQERPSSVDPDFRAKEETYRLVEPFLRKYADREFWTSEIAKEVVDAKVPGYLNTAANQRIMRMLWFAGFRPVETQRRTGGLSYKWGRPADEPWPTQFSLGNGQRKLVPAKQADQPALGTEEARKIVMTPLVQEALASMSLDGETFTVGTDEVEPDPEVAEVATITEKPNEDDTELALAVEQEQRAMAAERKAAGLEVTLDQEKRQHAQTRRDLMVRVANWEKKNAEAQAEITRLRSLIEEERHARRELGDGDDTSTLRRAHAAEQQVQQLQEQLAAATRAYEQQVQAVPVAVPQGDDGWWPLEGGGQTVEQLLAGAAQFGLEVRIQARRAAR